MYCPKCGKRLVLVERNPPQEINWNDNLEEINKQIEIWKNYDSVQSEEYYCEGGCFAVDYPLILHHPFNGIDSRATDSWSLSWIK